MKDIIDESMETAQLQQQQQSAEPLITSLNSKPVERHTSYYGLTLDDYNEKYGRQNNESWSSSVRSALRYVQRNVRCSKQLAVNCIRQWIPAIDVIRNYQFRRDFLGDVTSGINIGVITIPQSMGYSMLAGMPTYFGLYTSLFPVVVYFVFCTSRHVSIGTMALSSLIVRSAVIRGGSTGTSPTQTLPQIDVLGNDTTSFPMLSSTSSLAQLDDDDDLSRSVLIAMSVSFAAGIILLIMSFFQLGFIVSYMSDSFISGYLAASNLLVVMHQVKLVLGVPVKNRTGALELFYLTYDIFANIRHTNLTQLLISVLSITSLLLVKYCINERFKSRMKIPVPIDVIVVIITTLVCHFADLKQNYEVKVVGSISRGVPAPVLPSVSVMYTYLFEAAMLAIVSYMMVAMMATVFAQKYNYTIDNNQELAANGLASIFGSFFNSVCPSTSPARCCLMDSTGGRTQVAYLVSALLVLITLLGIAPLFQSLPVCVLASIIIVAYLPLFIHYKAWLDFWKTDRYDFIIWVVTFFTTLIAGVDSGLLIGIGFSLLIVHVRLQRSRGSKLLPSSDGSFVMLNSKLHSNVSHLNNAVIFKFSGPLYFATIDAFKRGLFSKTVSLNELKTKQHQAVEENHQQSQVGNNGQLQRNPSNDEAVLKISSDMETEQIETQTQGEIQSSIDGQEAAGNTAAGNDRGGGRLKSNGNVPDTNKGRPPRYIIISCSAIPFVDTGGARLLCQLYDAYAEHGVQLILAECNEDIINHLKQVEKCQLLKKNVVYPTVQDSLIALQVSYSPIAYC